MAMAQISKFLLLTIWNFITMSTFKFEVFLIMLFTMQNLMSTHAPLFFGKSCVPKNNLHIAYSKDDVNTPLVIFIFLG